MQHQPPQNHPAHWLSVSIAEMAKLHANIEAFELCSKALDTYTQSLMAPGSEKSVDTQKPGFYKMLQTLPNVQKQAQDLESTVRKLTAIQPEHASIIHTVYTHNPAIMAQDTEVRILTEMSETTSKSTNIRPPEWPFTSLSNVLGICDERAKKIYEMHQTASQKWEQALLKFKEKIDEWDVYYKKHDLETAQSQGRGAMEADKQPTDAKPDDSASVESDSVNSDEASAASTAPNAQDILKFINENFH